MESNVKGTCNINWEETVKEKIGTRNNLVGSWELTVGGTKKRLVGN